MRPAIVHALEPAFVSWATPFEPWLLWQLAQHPKFVGGKIRTLDEHHFLYWAAMCRARKLGFAPHSGDDFGIATAMPVGSIRSSSKATGTREWRQVGRDEEKRGASGRSLVGRHEVLSPGLQVIELDGSAIPPL